jgi:hypothetical protein
MTTPNQQGQPDPPGSITGYGSWPQVQGMSVDDWKADINSQWEGKFDPVQVGTNFLITVMLKLLASLLNMIPFVGDDLAAVVNNIAEGLNGTHNTAVTAGSTATAAQSTAGSAFDLASGLDTRVTDAEEAASNAANVAADAAEKADIAYKNAQYWKDEFVVSSGAVLLGYNEVDLGPVMDLPDDGIARVRKITAIRYGLKANNGTIRIDLYKTPVGSTTPVFVWTTNIPSGVTKFRDNLIDYTVADGEYYSCNVISMSGVASFLQCALIGVLIEAP